MDGTRRGRAAENLISRVTYVWQCYNLTNVICDINDDKLCTVGKMLGTLSIRALVGCGRTMWGLECTGNVEFDQLSANGAFYQLI